MSTPKVLYNYAANALAVLRSHYQASRLLQHNASAGAVREQVIKDFLAAHLPELISVVSGQIFDSRDAFSRQQDVVLVLKGTPRLPFASGIDLIFQEGVVATVEIKTTLNSSVLQTVGENIKSVRSLTSALAAVSSMGITHSWPSSRILTVVLTYDSTTVDTTFAALASLDEDARPDLLLDLSKGLWVRNHGLLLQQQPAVPYVFEADPARGFMAFLTMLTEITGTLSARGVAWRQYW